MTIFRETETAYTANADLSAPSTQWHGTSDEVDTDKVLDRLNHCLNHQVRSDWSRMAGLMEIARFEGVTPEIEAELRRQLENLNQSLLKMQAEIEQCRQRHPNE